MNGNFSAALGFVWQPGLDDPKDGYHVSPHDPGEGTFGGVIQETWKNAVEAGIVIGLLSKASPAQLKLVLQAKFWGSLCDALPNGLDLLYFNGLMMSGHYPKLMQQCLGFMGEDDVDGWIGPVTLKAIRASDPATLINALSGAHYAYLTTLSIWPDFKGGWTHRLKLAQPAALALTDAGIARSIIPGKATS